MVANQSNIGLPDICPAAGLRHADVHGDRKLQAVQRPAQKRPLLGQVRRGLPPPNKAALIG